MSPPPFEPAETRGFFQRYGFALGIVAVVGVVALIFGGQSFFSKRRPPPPKRAEVTMVNIVSTPPPPPPLPPPPPQRMLEDKMIEQAPVDDSEAPPDPAAAAPVADVGTSITGAGGPDAFGLSASRGGGRIGGTGPARSAASRWGWYASEVQVTVSDTLRRHPLTRDGDFRIEVRLWTDLTGRVTRARLVRPSGDAKFDAALCHEVLAGLQLKQLPPAGMPQPIVMRLTARRPH